MACAHRGTSLPYEGRANTAIALLKEGKREDSAGSRAVRSAPGERRSATFSATSVSVFCDFRKTLGSFRAFMHAGRDGDLQQFRRRVRVGNGVVTQNVLDPEVLQPSRQGEPRPSLQEFVGTLEGSVQDRARG